MQQQPETVFAKLTDDELSEIDPHALFDAADAAAYKTETERRGLDQ